MGLDHLSLDRATGVLSGGEAQRIRLVTQIGSGRSAAATPAGIEHGRIADEAMALDRAGLGPSAALGAASWAAREWLHRPGQEVGTPSDLVVCSSESRADIRVLAVPALVLLRGRIVATDSSVSPRIR